MWEKYCEEHEAYNLIDVFPPHGHGKIIFITL